MIDKIMSIGFDTEEMSIEAHKIALQYNFTVNNDVLPRLSRTLDKLVLLSENFSPLYVDFNSIDVRMRHDAGKKQGLLRACKIEPGTRILDATAGWGRDAAVLASFGANVLMLERTSIMAALLNDGLMRRNINSCGKLELLHIDSQDYLQTLPYFKYPDVIYIDPMHPSRQKSALVKKDMQLLQRIVGYDDDVCALIQLAIARTRQRVVVKWPQRLAPLLKPNLSITGKTVRFDVYFP